MLKNYRFLLVLLLIVSCKQGKKYHDASDFSTEITQEPQQDAAINDIRNFQKKLNSEYKNPETSPLLSEDRRGFNGIDFFPINTEYRVTAAFVRTPDEKPFLMPTTTGEKSREVKYGEIHFELKGSEFSLNVYQNQDLKFTAGYKKYLFLPFRDNTNGIETYGGGRYINLLIPEGDSIVVDFNKAYNPYCAYNPDYSCPIVPGENTLDTEVTVGVKAFKR